MYLLYENKQYFRSLTKNQPELPLDFVLGSSRVAVLCAPVSYPVDKYTPHPQPSFPPTEKETFLFFFSSFVFVFLFGLIVNTSIFLGITPNSMITGVLKLLTLCPLKGEEIWPTGTSPQKGEGKGKKCVLYYLFSVLSICKYFNILNLTQRSLIYGVLKSLALCPLHVHTNCKVIN